MRVLLRETLVAAALLSAAATPQVCQAGIDSLTTETIARQVGPHLFPGAVGIPNAFLSSHLSSTTGLAITLGMETDVYSLNDPPQFLATKQVDIAYLTQAFEYQQRVSNGVALRLALSGAGRMGSETAALVNEGVSVIMGWATGATVRLTERPGFKLSGSLDISGNSMTVVSPRNFVEDVLANGFSDSTNSLSADYSNLLATAGLRAAWGRSVTMGYMLFGDVGFQEPYKEDENEEVYWLAGGAVNFDMRERWRPDIGFLLGATLRSTSSRNEDLGGGGWSTNMGVYYTGHPDLTAGVQALYTQLKQTDVDNKFGALGISLVLRYDFF
jgi:hypothetical protein